MRVRRYHHEEDYDDLCAMMRGRGLEVPPKSRLPQWGWTIDNIIFAFLMQTDAKIGIVEYFVTNPDISDIDRLKACDLMIRKIEDKANYLGMEMLIGSSSIPKVIGLALRSGFVGDPAPYYYVRKLLLKGIEEHERRYGKPDVRRVVSTPAHEREESQ